MREFFSKFDWHPEIHHLDAGRESVSNDQDLKSKCDGRTDNGCKSFQWQNYQDMTSHGWKCSEEREREVTKY